MLDDLVTQMMQSECKDIPERLTEGKKKNTFTITLRFSMLCLNRCSCIKHFHTDVHY